MRLGTSLRTKPAAETAGAAEPLARRLGVTAITDITALDKLGLPVVVSLRPAGQVARVHAGKGLTPQDAHVGALMEAVECAVAERASARGPYAQRHLGDLHARLPGELVLGDFSPRVDAALQPGRPTAAVRCLDLLQLQRTLLPAELVMVPAPDEGLPPLFGWSTNGLASGNTLQEATLHGLLEVLERDSIAMSMARGDAVFIDLESLPAPLPGHARQWGDRGVRLFVRHLPCDFGLPCVEATLHEPGTGLLELARGWGVHFDRNVALARAVCEAAQARACRLHSVQPGMAAVYGTRMPGDTPETAQARQRFLGCVAADDARIDFRELPHWELHGVDAALSALLALLPEAGFRHVFRRRLHVEPGAAAPVDLHVVKVVVPRCENILVTRHRAGPRLREQAAARA